MKLLWAKVEAINPFIDPYDCHKIPVRGTWDQPWCLLWSYSVKESLVDCRSVRELRKSDCRRRLSFFYFWADMIVITAGFFGNFRWIEMNLDEFRPIAAWQSWQCLSLELPLLSGRGKNCWSSSKSKRGLRKEFEYRQTGGHAVPVCCMYIISDAHCFVLYCERLELLELQKRQDLL